MTFHRPSSHWPDTVRAAPNAELLSPATQIVSDRDAYLGQRRDEVGRRIDEANVELFIHGDVAGGLRREFESQLSEFIALHDLGCSGSLRLLARLAQDSGSRVQRLFIRRQGQGLALAVLQFVEVSLADGSRTRVYSTDVNCDAPVRQQVARVTLAWSKLGVVLVGDVPALALSAGLQPLHEAMQRGAWRNRDLLLVPMGSGTPLVAAAAGLGSDGLVAVRLAPRAAKTPQAWGFVCEAWNRLQSAASGQRHMTQGCEPVPSTLPSQTATALMPLDADRAALQPSPPTRAQPSPRAQEAATLTPPSPSPSPSPSPPPPPLPSPSPSPSPPALHALASALPSGFDRPRQAVPAAAAAATLTPTAPTPMPLPGAVDWQAYLNRCAAIQGVLGGCIFDTHTLKPLAHAGTAPPPQRLAQQGALLLADMQDSARALGLGTARPEAVISIGAHHLLLRHVAGHPGIALHLVLQAAQTSAALVRLHLERIPRAGTACARRHRSAQPPARRRCPSRTRACHRGRP